MVLSLRGKGRDPGSRQHGLSARGHPLPPNSSLISRWQPILAVLRAAISRLTAFRFRPAAAHCRAETRTAASLINEPG